MALFTEEERKAVEVAIAEAEARTAGELVVATIRRSSAYAFERLLGAVSWGFAGAFVLAWRFPDLESSIPGAGGWGASTGIDLMDALFAHLAITIVLWLVLGWPPLLRGLLPRARTQSVARERAVRMFAEYGIYRTRDRTGLLIMLSEFERQVVILGDEGIDEQVGLEGWEGHVQHIVEGIRDGKSGAAVVKVLAEMAELLEATVPQRRFGFTGDGDINELSDEVIEE